MGVKNFFLLLVFIFAVFYFESGIKDLPASRSTKLTIVSDFLEQKDTALFRAFSKKFQVSVKIYELSDDKLIGFLRNHPFGSEIDLVMMKSLYNVHKLAKFGVFHDLGQVLGQHSYPNRFVSHSYNFVGIGVDPFVFTYAADSIKHLKTYGELNTKHFDSDLDRSEEITFLSSIIPKLRKVGSYNWISAYTEMLQDPEVFSDTLVDREVNTTLTSYSSYLSAMKSNRQIRYFLPNQFADGCFYNMRTVAVIKQCENFENAQLFLRYYLSERANVSLNKGMHTFSIYRLDAMRYYRVKSDELMQYYGMIERILNKVN